ncbi:hypothetical protein B0H13DRAFT_2313300 [Mycena leptocephala]|nr:hypothetical protein B0H13DRAFT_2313300 [Mycena leptocephala]
MEFPFNHLNPTDFYATPQRPKPRAGASRSVFAAPVATPAATTSSQPRLRAKARTKWQKVNDILGHITKDLDGLGNFLELLFYNRPHGTKDLRTKRHKSMVTAFLGGQNIGANSVKMGHIIDLIYSHRQSQPPPGSPERDLAFSHKTTSPS